MIKKILTISLVLFAILLSKTNQLSVEGEPVRNVNYIEYKNHFNRDTAIIAFWSELYILDNLQVFNLNGKELDSKLAEDMSVFALPEATEEIIIRAVGYDDLRLNLSDFGIKSFNNKEGFLFKLAGNPKGVKRKLFAYGDDEYAILKFKFNPFTKIRINGILIEKRKANEIRIIPQHVIIEAKLQGYEDINEFVEIKKGQVYTKDFFPDIVSSCLEIRVFAADAQIKISCGEFEETYTGSHIKKIGLPIGEYEIHVSSDGYYPNNSRFILEEGEKTYKEVRLEAIPTEEVLL